ncbi:MAG: hypothetical protein KDA24_26865 [Deltaproteobacteria bacterium]|nr:hypothetical protein [Deltaproteobacteria bacterium]
MIRSRFALLAVLSLFAVTACKGDSSKGGESSDKPAAPAEGQVPFSKLDFGALPADFPAAMKEIRASQIWSEQSKAMGEGDAKADPRTRMNLKMSAELLNETRGLGCAFLENWQLPEGNFRYMYDWVDKTWVSDDHQVRQAGSLWGVGTCYRHEQTAKSKEVLDKGLKFWFENTIPGPEEGTLMMKYPGDHWLHSGTVALVALAIIEYLKTDAPMDAAYKTELESKLDGYMKWLVWMQRDNGHISDRFDHRNNRKRERSSPYYDGETLLAMTKAARQLDMKFLVPVIEEAAPAMSKTYTIKSWKKDRDSNQTKGFFQWGSMSFAEYYVAGWKDKELYADVGLSLGYWMIHTHRTLSRRRNHAYAMEGLIANWRMANMRGDIAAQTDLLYVIDRSMNKLFSWQIGGPLAKNNKWLKDQGKDDPLAVGGIMNARKPSGADVKKDVSHQLRIDVTQHQMHATTMALEHVYVPVK